MISPWPARILFFASLGAVAVAAWLAPDARGLGSHEQLHLPPCGFLLTAGFPCPFCGVTTSFCHMVRGQILTAFVVQPFGACLALLTLFTPLWALRSNYCKRPFFASWMHSHWPLIIPSIGVLCAAGWFYKIFSYRGHF